MRSILRVNFKPCHRFPTSLSRHGVGRAGRLRLGIDDENALQMVDGSIQAYLLKILVATRSLSLLTDYPLVTLIYDFGNAVIWPAVACQRIDVAPLDPASFGAYFAQVVKRGFRLKHTDAQEFVHELEGALKHWKEAFSRRELPDPDMMIFETPADATLQMRPQTILSHFALAV